MPKVKVEGRNEIYRFPDGASREDMARQVRNHMFPRQSTASTAAKVGSAAGFLAPGTGIADVIGAYPTGEGTNYPSLVQNILQGNFATAGWQALGAVGDMAYASVPVTGPLGVGIGMAAKVPRAARAARAGIEATAPTVRGAEAIPTEGVPLTREAFLAVGEAQRDVPERAMLRVQRALGGGVLNPVVEHVGDITHRMNDPHTFRDAGYEFVRPKVERALRALRSDYGFGREHAENMINNAEGFGRDWGDYKHELYTALARYADEHKRLPAYNATQRHARDAAVAIGEQRWWVAEDHLQALMDILEQGPEAWKKAAHEGLIP